MEEKNRLEKVHKYKAVIAAVICFLIAFLFCIVYMAVTRHVEIIDISEIPVITADEDTYFYVSESWNAHNMIVIHAETENADIYYDYHNFTVGDGSGVYRKITVLLVDDDGKTAYALVTYPYVVQTLEQDILIDETRVVGYASEKMYKEGFSRLAVMYEDRGGQRCILYEGQF